LVDRRGCLGRVQRVTQRQNDRACRERDLVRVRRDPAEIDPGVVDLPDIAETGVAQRHVPDPKCCETQLLGAAGQAFLIAHRRFVTLKRLDREEHADRQLVRREHPPEPGAISGGCRPVRFQHG
jgi:hypothetical protein